MFVGYDWAGCMRRSSRRADALNASPRADVHGLLLEARVTRASGPRSWESVVHSFPFSVIGCGLGGRTYCACAVCGMCLEGHDKLFGASSFPPWEPRVGLRDRLSMIQKSTAVV